jgi:hypothetical protein
MVATPDVASNVRDGVNTPSRPGTVDVVVVVVVVVIEVIVVPRILSHPKLHRLSDYDNDNDCV